MIIHSFSPRIIRVVLRSFASTMSQPKTLSIKPEITATQREQIKACCALEISFNRLSFVKLRLDRTQPNQVVLDVWDSVPLRLPGGKEFKPQVCAHVLSSSLDKLNSVFRPHPNPTEEPSLSLSQNIALIVASMPMLKSTLNYAGLLGYLIGHIEHISSSATPVFTIDWRFKKRFLGDWIAFTAGAASEELVSLDHLFKRFPLLHVDDSQKTVYAERLSSLDADSTFIQQGHLSVPYGTLVMVNLLCDAYTFIVHGLLGVTVE